MTQKTYEPMRHGVEDKNILLKQFTGAEPAKRKKFMRLAEQQGFVDAAELTRDRDEAFFGCCVADMRARGRSDDETKKFVSKLGSLPNDELDFLVVLCTDVENTKVTFVPGFTRHIERLFQTAVVQ
jgi:hypothetical protein